MHRLTAIVATLLATAAHAQTPPPAQSATTPAPVPPAPVVPAVDPYVLQLREKALRDDVAWKIVEDMTTEVGPRMTDGSPAQARARDWSVERLTQLGFQNVRVESYTIPNAWERGVETAEVISPFAQPLHVTALGRSGSTPVRGVTGTVAYFQTLADLERAPEDSLKGRIAFVSNQMEPTQDGSSYAASGRARFAGPAIAARKGAAAILIRSIGTDEGRGPHTGTTMWPEGMKPIPAAALSVADAANLERMVRRDHGVMLRLVLTPKFVGKRTSGNVVAEVPGSDPAAGTITIGGHLDSWDLGTGAIDDASGLAITAAAARLIQQSGKAPRRTIRVVWFGDEEIGGLGGEEHAKLHAGERHAITAESDFGADRVWRVQAPFTGAAAPVADRLAAALAPLGIVRGAGKPHGGTDVEPLMKLGVPAVDLNQSGLRYFDYHHTPEDTLERVDPEQLRQNVAAWATMLAIVANAPESIGNEGGNVENAANGGGSSQP
jgi:hypothetical protein